MVSREKSMPGSAWSPLVATGRFDSVVYRGEQGSRGCGPRAGEKRKCARWTGLRRSSPWACREKRNWTRLPCLRRSRKPMAPPRVKRQRPPRGRCWSWEGRGEGPPLGAASGGEDLAIPAGGDAGPTGSPAWAVVKGGVEAQGAFEVAMVAAWEGQADGARAAGAHRMGCAMSVPAMRAETGLPTKPRARGWAAGGAAGRGAGGGAGRGMGGAACGGGR
jgi:hypothetical protein